MILLNLCDLEAMKCSEQRQVMTGSLLC